MKKIVFLIITLLNISKINSQEVIYTKIDSYELNTARNVQIYVPKSYEKDAEKEYPLAVVLDGAILFDIYTANAKLFAKTDKAPEQIIIGITMNESAKQRNKDCMYNKVTSLPTAESEKFYRFIRSEVLDYMEENYRISPFKTIVGNTLTGNFINYFFIENNPGFNAFININPSYALDMPEGIYSKASALKSEDAYHYYLCNGDYNSKKRKISIENVNTKLETVENEAFNYKYKIFDHTSKIATIGQAIPDAFAFIFDIYSAISKEEFDKNIKDLSPADAIAYLENKYVDIEYLFGSDLKIRERDIYAIEGIILDKENGDFLNEFGSMIMRLFPESPIGDYYVGQYFEKAKKYKRAITHYKNGYAKISTENQEEADGYYQNIERVLGKMDGSIPDEEAPADEEEKE